MNRSPRVRRENLTTGDRFFIFMNSRKIVIIQMNGEVGKRLYRTTNFISPQQYFPLENILCSPFTSNISSDIIRIKRRTYVWKKYSFTLMSMNKIESIKQVRRMFIGSKQCIKELETEVFWFKEILKRKHGETYYRNG